MDKSIVAKPGNEFMEGFGAGTIRAAEFDDEAAVLGIVEEAGVVTVLTRPIDIAFENDGLHVVVENSPGCPAQGEEGFLMAVDQGADFHVGNEFDVAGPAVAERDMLTLRVTDKAVARTVSAGWNVNISYDQEDKIAEIEIIDAIPGGFWPPMKLYRWTSDSIRIPRAITPGGDMETPNEKYAAVYPSAPCGAPQALTQVLPRHGFIGEPQVDWASDPNTPVVQLSWVRQPAPLGRAQPSGTTRVAKHE